jgi:hypothetical protein
MPTPAEMIERIDDMLLEDESVDIAPTPNPQFVIDSDERAEWLLGKLGNIESEQARVRARAAKIIEGLEKDAESLKARYLEDLSRFVQAKLLMKRGKEKYIDFLQARVQFRKVGARKGGLKITDPDAALAYAETALPNAIEIIHKLKPAVYIEAAQATGEALPGVENIEPVAATDKLYIEFSTPAPPKPEEECPAAIDEGVRDD